eukprot:7752521-Lingulodinium_polyedra.AAC.1
MPAASCRGMEAGRGQALLGVRVPAEAVRRHLEVRGQGRGGPSRPGRHAAVGHAALLRALRALQAVRARTAPTG